MAKKPQQTEAVQFALTAPVWRGSERLPVGTIVTFENDEPAGVYKGRCKPVGTAVAVQGEPDAALLARAEKAEAVAAEATARAEKAEADLAAALKATPPPAPPAP